MRRQHYVVSLQSGKVIAGPDGNPLDDDGVKLAAQDRMLKIMEFRAKLKGHFAATKSRVEVVSVDDFAESDLAHPGPAPEYLRQSPGPGIPVRDGRGPGEAAPPPGNRSN